MKPIAEVRQACGRAYLSVAGLAVCMETDLCRDIHMVEYATEKDYLVDKWGDPHMVWTVRLLEKAAEIINNANQSA